MKKLALLFTAVVTMTLTSCSNEETLLNQELELASSKSLLESYSLKRDDRGSYSLETKTTDNASFETYKNEVTGVNEINIFQDDNASASRQVAQNLELDNNSLKLAFFDANTAKKSTLTIQDGEINATQRTTDTLENFLNSYEVVNNEDGTYSFNFEVKDSVEINYVYNEAEGINEIHLTEDGTGPATAYSKLYSVDENGSLKVDFVNNYGSEGTRVVQTRRPRLGIQD